MTRLDAETMLSGLIEDVLARLETRQIGETSAALRWERVKASRSDPAEAEFCESAGALGLDPYQIGADDAESIEEAASLFEGEPLTELLAGAAMTDRPLLLDWVKFVGRRRTGASLVASLGAIAAEATRATPARQEDASWALGYRRARAMRRVLALDVGDRFRSFRPLAKRSGAGRSFELAKPIDGIRALRSDHANGVHVHMRSFGSSPWAPAPHLFNFARAVGDAACFPAESRPPINLLQSASRQAAGRAFAAEFLAPITEIQSMLEDRRDVDTIAAELGVSVATVGHQVENKARIEAACA